MLILFLFLFLSSFFIIKVTPGTFHCTCYTGGNNCVSLIDYSLKKMIMKMMKLTMIDEIDENKRNFRTIAVIIELIIIM